MNNLLSMIILDPSVLQAQYLIYVKKKRNLGLLNKNAKLQLAPRLFAKRNTKAP